MGYEIALEEPCACPKGEAGEEGQGPRVALSQWGDGLQYGHNHSGKA